MSSQEREPQDRGLLDRFLGKAATRRSPKAGSSRSITISKAAQQRDKFADGIKSFKIVNDAGTEMLGHGCQNVGAAISYCKKNDTILHAIYETGEEVEFFYGKDRTTLHATVIWPARTIEGQKRGFDIINIHRSAIHGHGCTTVDEAVAYIQRLMCHGWSVRVYKEDGGSMSIYPKINPAPLPDKDDKKPEVDRLDDPSIEFEIVGKNSLRVVTTHGCKTLREAEAWVTRSGGSMFEIVDLSEAKPKPKLPANVTPTLTVEGLGPPKAEDKTPKVKKYIPDPEIVKTHPNPPTKEKHGTIWEEIAFDQMCGLYIVMVCINSEPGLEWRWPSRNYVGSPSTSYPLSKWQVDQKTWKGYIPAARTWQSPTPPSSTSRYPHTSYGNYGPKKTKAEKMKEEKLGLTGFEKDGKSFTHEALAGLLLVQRLVDMFTWQREAGSAGEEAFIEKFIVPLGSTRDKYGNRWIRVLGPKGEDPTILFSSHTDTVHRNPKPKSANADDHKQKVVFEDKRIYSEDGNCLGGDDTCGVWLMLEMIQAQVPGVYLFHREEECGGRGSAYVRDHLRAKLKGLKAAIAFDRKGYTDVIYRQGGTRCCSDEFAKSLATLLGGNYKPDPGGSFTDTKNYINIIGECANVSCGYFNAHGPMEWVNVEFLVNLRDQLVNADWSKLEFKRQPGETEVSIYGGAGGYNRGRPYGGSGGFYDDDDWSYYYGGQLGGGGTSASTGGKAPVPAAPQASGAGRKKGGDLPLPKTLVRKLPQSRPINRQKAADNVGPRASLLADRAVDRRFDRMVERLEDLLNYVTAYPETVAHFLWDEGYNVSHITKFFRDYDDPDRQSWDPFADDSEDVPQ